MIEISDKWLKIMPFKEDVKVWHNFNFTWGKTRKMHNMIVFHFISISKFYPSSSNSKVDWDIGMLSSWLLRTDSETFARVSSVWLVHNVWYINTAALTLNVVLKSNPRVWLRTLKLLQLLFGRFVKFVGGLLRDNIYVPISDIPLL